MEELSTKKFHGILGSTHPLGAAVKIKGVNDCKSHGAEPGASYNYNSRLSQYTCYNNASLWLCLGPNSAVLKKLFNLFQPVCSSLKQEQKVVPMHTEKLHKSLKCY